MLSAAHVMLSAAKHLTASIGSVGEILRYAQDDNEGCLQDDYRSCPVFHVMAPLATHEEAR